MRTSKKKFYRKRQTASAMAVLLTVLSPGVFPAGIAMADGFRKEEPVMQEQPRVM